MGETAIPGLSAEANIFAKHPDGFGVHIKVICENGRAIVGNLDVAIAGLVAKGYTPDVRPAGTNGHNGNENGASGPQRGPAGKRGGKPSGRYTGEVYTECPWCQSDVYDNRTKKANEPNWRGPWFKCKAGDDCGFVVFKNDGTTGD